MSPRIPNLTHRHDVLTPRSNRGLWQRCTGFLGGIRRGPAIACLAGFAVLAAGSTALASHDYYSRYTSRAVSSACYQEAFHSRHARDGYVNVDGRYHYLRQRHHSGSRVSINVNLGHHGRYTETYHRYHYTPTYTHRYYAAHHRPHPTFAASYFRHQPRHSFGVTYARPAPRYYAAPRVICPTTRPGWHVPHYYHTPSRFHHRHTPRYHHGTGLHLRLHYRR